MRTSSNVPVALQYAKEQGIPFVDTFIGLSQIIGVRIHTLTQAITHTYITLEPQGYCPNSVSSCDRSSPEMTRTFEIRTISIVTLLRTESSQKNNVLMRGRKFKTLLRKTKSTFLQSTGWYYYKENDTKVFVERLAFHKRVGGNEQDESRSHRSRTWFTSSVRNKTSSITRLCTNK